MDECFGRKPERPSQYCPECQAEFCLYHPGFPVALRKQGRRPGTLYPEYPITGWEIVGEKRGERNLAEVE